MSECRMAPIRNQCRQQAGYGRWWVAGRRSSGGVGAEAEPTMAAEETAGRQWWCRQAGRKGCGRQNVVHKQHGYTWTPAAKTAVAPEKRGANAKDAMRHCLRAVRSA